MLHPLRVLLLQWRQTCLVHAAPSRSSFVWLSVRQIKYLFAGSTTAISLDISSADSASVHAVKAPGGGNLIEFVGVDTCDSFCKVSTSLFFCCEAFEGVPDAVFPQLVINNWHTSNNSECTKERYELQAQLYSML